MFFILSKIAWLFFDPLLIVFTFLLLGLFWYGRPRGKRCLIAAALIFSVCAFFPVGHNLLVALERRYPLPDPLPNDITGIVVLGGAVNGQKSAELGQVQLNSHATRITQMLILSRTYPQAKIIYSGGSGDLQGPVVPEADQVKKLLEQIDIKRKNIVFENKSRTTFENMIYSRELAHPQAGEKWLLVTSAYHLPRAVQVFQSGGWDVLPYPAGYLTEKKYEFAPNFEVLGNFYKFQIALKEIIGIIAYTVTGRIGFTHDKVADVQFLPHFVVYTAGDGRDRTCDWCSQSFAAPVLFGVVGSVKS